MFTNKTPLEISDDIAKSVTSAFKMLPKNEDEVKANFEKLKRVFDSEVESTKQMWATYQKSATGDATINEINAANKKAKELACQASLGAFLLLPGSFFLLPFIISTARSNGVELVPESVKKEFKI